jgi:hypothetical protein
MQSVSSTQNIETTSLVDVCNTDVQHSWRIKSWRHIIIPWQSKYPLIWNTHLCKTTTMTVVSLVYCRPHEIL